MRISRQRVPLSSRKTLWRWASLSRTPPARARCAVVDSPKKKTPERASSCVLGKTKGSLTSAWADTVSIQKAKKTVSNFNQVFIREPSFASILFYHALPTSGKDMYQCDQDPINNGEQHEHKKHVNARGKTACRQKHKEQEGYY